MTDFHGDQAKKIFFFFAKKIQNGRFFKMAVFQNSQFSKKKVSSKFLAMLNIMLYNVSNFSQGEKEKTGCKVVQIHKITIIFTQNDTLGQFCLKIVVIL